MAIYPSRQLDPLADEPCAGLAAVAELSAVAGGSALDSAGVWLLLFDYRQLDSSGLLAEQLEARLTGATPPDVGVFGIMKDIPRIMKREWQKLAWYLPRAIVLLLLYFIPGVGQTVAPVLWFLFSAWMLAIQYCDYPFDNHKVPFKTMREALRSRKVMNMQFGALTSLFTMIPVLNLVILPVAICGATAMWVDCYRDKHAVWK